MTPRRINRSTVVLLVAACTSNLWIGCSWAFVLPNPRQQQFRQTGVVCRSIATTTRLSAATDSNEKKQDYGLQRIKIGGDSDFWTQQKELAQEMTESTRKTLRQAESEKFEQRRLALVGDTAYITIFIFCALWAGFENPLTALSYTVGAILGLAYTYGLGKSVAALGASIDDVEQVQGAGVGEARFAFLILLFVVLGKFRSDGLQEVPAIAGFFTYQLASLYQGLREIND